MLLGGFVFRNDCDLVGQLAIDSTVLMILTALGLIDYAILLQLVWIVMHGVGIRVQLFDLFWSTVNFIKTEVFIAII